MGTNRTRLFCGLISGLVFSIIVVAGGQTKSAAQSTQNAYYQPLTQEQYHQHAQTAFDETATTRPKSQEQRRAQDFGSQFNNRFSTPTRDRVTPEIQQRASRLLRRQQAQTQIGKIQFGPQSNSATSPNTTSVIRYRRPQQEDPFGEQHVQAPANQDRDQFEIPAIEGAGQFQPFANPPQQDQDKKQDPFGEDQVPKSDKEPPIKKPEEKPPAIEPKTDPPQVPEKTPEPKQDPVTQEPKQDPVTQEPKQEPALPKDAQFNPKPTEQPKLTDPVVQPPADVTQPPAEVVPTDPTQTRPQQSPRRRDRRATGSGIEYFQGKPLQEKYDRTPIYYEQPAVMMPPIVQPGQIAPYQAAPYQAAPYQAAPYQTAPYQTQPYAVPSQPAVINPPIYQPDYQPIPGLAPDPVYVPSSESPMPPGVFIPKVRSAVPIETVPAVDPQATNEVYSGVVSNQCETNCGPCANGCPNFYVSVFGGFSQLRDMDGASGIRQIGSGDGGGVGVALGRRNGRNLRTEAEFSYRHHSLDSFVVSPVPGAANMPVGGDLNSFAGMANAYWEIIDVPTRCFKPYVGVGIGFVGINAEIRDSLKRNIVPTGLETDSSFAYQWIGGVNYKAYRNVDLFAEYRYFSADTYRIDPAVPGLGDRYSFKTDNVYFGFRWKF